MERPGEQFGRLITAMVTPSETVNPNNVSAPKTRLLVEHLIQTSTEGIVVTGTTGESYALTETERRLVLVTTLAVADGRIPVIAGTSTYNTRESVELSQRAQRDGAQGLLLVSPAYYNNAPPEGVKRHFATILEAVSLPTILYNVPSRTNGKNITPEVFFRLAEQFPHVVGIKEARGADTEEGREYIEREFSEMPDNLVMWSGNDADLFWFLQRGGFGVVSVASHVAGDRIRRTMDYYLEGKENDARRLDEAMQPLYKALFPPEAPVSSPATIKKLLNLIGIDVGPVRSPLVEVEEVKPEFLSTLDDLIGYYKLTGEPKIPAK